MIMGKRFQPEFATNLRRRQALALGCLLSLSCLGSQTCQAQPNDSVGTSWQPSKRPADFVQQDGGAQLLLEQLRARDQFLDGRTLEIHKRWEERVNPLTQRLANARAHRRVGAKVEPLKVDQLPQPYEQPHRVHYQITQRGAEKTVRIVADLEPRIHQGFGERANAGYKWTNIGECAVGYSPLTRIAHKQDSHDYAAMPWAVRSFRWSCGFGYSPFITEAKSLQRQGDRTVLFATMKLLADDESGCTLHLDQDWIVRKAVMVLPSKPNGTNDYVVVTKGTNQSGPLPMAETGHYRRILRPEGEKFRIYEDYQVDFVAISDRLSDEEYRRTTEIEIPDDVTVVDIRSVIRK